MNPLYYTVLAAIFSSGRCVFVYDMLYSWDNSPYSFQKIYIRVLLTIFEIMFLRPNKIPKQVAIQSLFILVYCPL